MAKKRIPLESDQADEKTPFTADPDHLKRRMDKSHMPDEPQPRRRIGGRDYVESEAVRMLVDTLREKGVSEAFINNNMDTIRKKALDHLYGRD